METLLNALVGFGHLRRRRGLYRNTGVAQRWFTSGSKRTLKHIVLFFYEVWDLMDSLEDAVQGKPTRAKDLHDPTRPPEFWEHYLRGLAEIRRYNTWEMVRRLPMPASPTRPLDAGGGHGMLSVACRHYPGLHAEVLDPRPPPRWGASSKADYHRVLPRGICPPTGEIATPFPLHLVHHFSPKRSGGCSAARSRP